MPPRFLNLCEAQQLLSFFNGLGVVKGEGVATAKKASPFSLKCSFNARTKSVLKNQTLKLSIRLTRIKFRFLTSQLSQAQLCDEWLRPFKTPKVIYPTIAD
ncbi:hypothetical protein CHL9004_08995 [Campylobacter hyointestinalis subsp. lawsonii]|nr:hypothetical protein CHL9004_08995 [Campylobacter hyointestinalis subsp. lawsonii]